MQLRKIVTFTETTLIEGGRMAPVPIKLFAAAAVLTNRKRVCRKSKT